MKESSDDDIFRKTFTMSPDGVNINRLSDGLYVSINDGFSILTGYNKDEVIGKTSFEINIWANPDDRDKLLDELQKYGRVGNFETKFITKDGTIRDGIVSALLIEIQGKPHILSLTKDITEIKQIKKALEESETRYKQLVELSPDGILLVSNDGTITDVNSKMLKMSGRTIEELIGACVSILFSPQELQRVPFLYSTLNIGDSVVRERNLLRPDGVFVPLEMHTRMLPDRSYQMVCHDLTLLRNSEYELRKLSEAVEQSPVSIVITDTDGRIEYVNSKLCEISGYNKEELIGKYPSIWSSGEKPRESYEKLWKTIISGDDWKGEFHNRKKSGELYWELASISPIKNENNEITNYLGIKEDITHRKLLEEQTLTSEQRYRDLFLNNPIPAYIFDEESLKFIEVNDAMVQNYQFTREEFSRMTLKDMRLPEDVPILLDFLQKAQYEVFQSASVYHKRKDGSVFPVDVTSHSLPEKNGRRSRLAMAIDITDNVIAAEQMKIAKEKAEASDRLKTTFLNNISHEVRTPLNGIIGFTEIILQPGISEKDKADSIVMLIESSDRLLNTINNYMDISLITSGSLTINKKELKPSEILNTLFEKYKSLSAEKNLNLILEMPDESGRFLLYTDPEILQKIIDHLLDNAIKFTERGTIRFGFNRRGDRLEFFTRDTGLGISRDHLETIFERFTKGEHSAVRQTEGSGLGLPIAKGMIERLGSIIRVDSEPDRGSVFSFELPIMNIEDVNSEKIPDHVNIRETENPLIMVAEDDETNFFYLNALLKMETKATIIHASNGIEAIDLFKKNPDIGLILMDIKMPEMDGLEATRQIKRLKKDVPIIAITAYAMSGDKEKVLAAGCDGYLSKPINKRNLLMKMGELYKV